MLKYVLSWFNVIMHKIKANRTSHQMLLFAKTTVQKSSYFKMMGTSRHSTSIMTGWTHLSKSKVDKFLSIFAARGNY